MDKIYSKLMRYGKRVVSNYTGENFIIVELKMGSEKDGLVKCVSEQNYTRFSFLKTWKGNHVGLTPEQEQEMEEYVQFLRIGDVRPANKIRFITKHYDLKFEVNDLECVLVDGERKKVAYIDECHFGFVGHNGTLTNVFHIREYAEVLDRAGKKVVSC